MKIKLCISLLLTLLFVSCGQPKPKEIEREPISEEELIAQYDELDNLSEYARTLVVPTMEHLIPADSNSLYCATLLFAWDEVRKIIGSPLTIPAKYADLGLVNASASFRNVLKQNEYTACGEVDGDYVFARAIFQKSLPFVYQLRKLDHKLTFDGHKVAAFGVDGSDDECMTNSVEILYYKNSNNFIVKLKPADKEHEIILFKTGETYRTMAEMVETSDSLIQIGKKVRSIPSERWKCQFLEDDELVVPDVEFDISANFDKLTDNEFGSNALNYKILQAWQRTAFKLNEMGAELESQAEIVLCLEEEEDKPAPKKMIFDKPFYVMLRRADAPNPYFCLHVVNAELLVKE